MLELTVPPLLERLALRFPTTGFVGLDWQYKSIYHAAQRVRAAGLNNVALLRAASQDRLGRNHFP